MLLTDPTRHPHSRLPFWRRRVLALALPLCIMAGNAAAQKALPLSGDYWGTHDPSIAKDGNTWYVFATGTAPDGGQFAVRCSTDLMAWQLCGHVFDSIPEWVRTARPETKELRAPDVSHVHGEFRLYYAYSLFGKNTSGIGLATNRTLDPHSPEYKWVDKGLVLRSVAADNYNAIDPNYVEDAQGRSWLAFGSFWGGIKLRRLNADGLASNEDTAIYSLATRLHKPSDAPGKPGLPPDWQAIEAPFIVRHGRYYYLFVSWDMCCRGAKSTYKTIVGRANEIKGPYLDREGNSMAAGGGNRTAEWKWQLGRAGRRVGTDV